MGVDAWLIAWASAGLLCRPRIPSLKKIWEPSLGPPSSLSIGIRLATAIKAFAQKNAVSTVGDQSVIQNAIAAATVLTAMPEAEKATPSHVPSFSPARSQTFPPPNGQLLRRTIAPRK